MTWNLMQEAKCWQKALRSASAPEVVGAECWREAFPDEAPPVISLGCEQIRLLLLMCQLHTTLAFPHAQLRSLPCIMSANAHAA